MVIGMEFSSSIEDDVLLSEDVRSSVDSWTDDVSDDKRFTDTVESYNRSIRFRIMCIVLMAAASVVIAVVSIESGPMSGDLAETVQILWDKFLGQADTSDTTVYWTLYATPAVLGALIGGAGLAICGAIMQSTLRNPMADPYTTGI